MLNCAGGAERATGALKEEQMKTREILSAFGLQLWRSYGRWFACRPTEGPAFAEHSAKSTRELVEMIVPPPPVTLSPKAIQAWAEECLASCYGNVNPEALAKAAFAAYDISPPDEFVECFVSACQVDRRRLMERRG